MNFRQPFKGEYPITQAYGEVVPGVTVGTAHTGIDYGCPQGTQILASGAGEVMFAGWDPTGYGLCVIIKHSSARSTLYAHLSNSKVNKGDKVRQGQPIGLSGSSGYATGPHLHFEARYRWDDYKSHFDPMLLPLQSVDEKSSLKAADAFREGDILKISAPLGAKGFYNDSFDFFMPYQQGASFYFTGKAVKHNGYEYMQVIPMQRPVWSAVHDGDTQILEKNE